VFAVVTVAAALEGWLSTVPAGGQFDNRIAAFDALAMVITSAIPRARGVTAPLLVCVYIRETLMSPRYAELVARRAPRGVARFSTPITSGSITRRCSVRRSRIRPHSCRGISVSVRDVLRANDERFRAVAEHISDEEWSRPSLCDA
jgi:hypothetical protein